MPETLVHNGNLGLRRDGGVARVEPARRLLAVGACGRLGLACQHRRSGLKPQVAVPLPDAGQGK